jgi:hypothetical protein
MMLIFEMKVMKVIMLWIEIGSEKIGIKMDVVNNEMNKRGGKCEFNEGWSFKMIRCRYLKKMNNVKIIKDKYE